MNKMNSISKRTLTSYLKGTSIAGLVFMGVILLIGILVFIFGSNEFATFQVEIEGVNLVFPDGTITFLDILRVIVLIVTTFFAVVLTFFPVYYTSVSFDNSLRLGVSRQTYFIYTSVVVLAVPLITTLMSGLMSVLYTQPLSELFGYFTYSDYISDLTIGVLLAILGMSIYKYGYKTFIAFIIIPLLEIIMAILIAVLPYNYIENLILFYQNNSSILTTIFVAFLFGIYYMVVKRSNIKLG